MAMGAPTVANLQKHFRDLTEDDALLIREIVRLADEPEALAAKIREKCPETHAYARSCYNDPFDSPMWRRTMVLHAIDRIVGGFGIEPLGTVNMHKGPPYEYVNFGDPYVTTLIYHRNIDRLSIGCWGDIAERLH